jgi:hypothetical protein
MIPSRPVLVCTASDHLPPQLTGTRAYRLPGVRRVPAAGAVLEFLLAGSRIWALAMQTYARLDAIVGCVQPNQLITVLRAQRHFADAVLAFSDDPGPANLERYLAASSALEQSRRARRHRRRARPRA